MIILAIARPSGPSPAADPVVLAAGDIASCDSNGDEETAALLDGHAGTVLALGDNAYEQGTLHEFQTCYAPTWGRHKSRTRPAPGNHEYLTVGAAGYFSYFGRAARPSGRSYYSFDLGSWHVVSLNSERVTTAQVRWLRKDLARAPTDCVLAYWHRPRWTGGRYADDPRTAPFWNALYDARADVVLTAHDHNYQRYPPMNKRGAIVRRRGIRSFVVGTGGRNLYALRADRRRRAGNDQSWGLLELILRPGGYSWRFIPVADGQYRDSGSGTCSRR